MTAAAFSAKSLPDEEFRTRVVTVTPSTSYPTGGEPFVPANARLRAIAAVAVANDISGRVWTFDQAASTLRAFRQGAGAGDLTEVAAGQDLSATPFQIVVFGPV